MCIFQFLSDHKDAFEALKNLAEILAIIIGAIWTLYFFSLKRQKYPRAKLEQKAHWWLLTEGKIAVRVTVTIHNKGEVLLKLASGFTWVQQVKPLLKDFKDTLISGGDPVKDNETEIQWPLSGERHYFKCGKMEIEPGENDEVYSDFVIDSQAEKLLIYSHIENETKSVMNWLKILNAGKIDSAGGGIGWNVSTLVDLSEQHNGNRKA
jgi:hypothetical protein